MKHIDCTYYLPIDAFKGLCKRDKSSIVSDGDSCENFEKKKKCEHCTNFKLVAENIGRCMDKYDAYPEMNAYTCDNFQWN